MTTPYGTTTFRHEPGNTSATFRRIEATDPAGGTERLEFYLQDNGFAATAASGDVPTGFSVSNQRLDYWNSFYWDKQAMALNPGDFSKAVNYNWMLAVDVSYGHPMSRPIPHSIKYPLQSRIWYRYPGQSSASDHTLGPDGARPSLIGRVLDGGASQVAQVTYNDHGNVTSIIDPAGRQTTHAYATNGLDLLNVHQVVSGGTDLLAEYSDYTTLHQPETVQDAAGEASTLTYNSFGQPLTVTNALTSLGAIGDDSSREAMTALLSDTDAEVREMTSVALKSIDARLSRK